jgi:hypothetical protein
MGAGDWNRDNAESEDERPDKRFVAKESSGHT